jgi:hypothetical protein
MFMVGNQRAGDLEMLQETAGRSGVLTGNEIDLLENANSAESDVFQIADGRGDHVERSGHSSIQDSEVPRFRSHFTQQVLSSGLQMSDLSQMKGVRVEGETVVWQPAGSDRRYALDINVIDDLTPVVMKGYASVPKRGAEVGGLLLGSVQPDGTTRITAFVPTDCEYASGPSFLLSNRDIKTLEGKLKAMTAAGRVIVGMYRSNTRGEFVLEATDRELFRQYFTDPATVFLLIEPSMTKLSYGSLIPQSEVENATGLMTNQFPFRRKELGAPPRPQAVKTTHTTGAYAVPGNVTQEAAALRTGRYSPMNANVAVEEPAESIKPQKNRFSPMLLSALIGLLGLALGAVIGFNRGQRSVENDLALVYQFPVTVSTQDGKSVVSWNPKSPSVKNAAVGMLVVDDAGPGTPLSKDQLETGQIVYNRAPIRGRLILKYAGDAALSSEFSSR